MMEHWLEIPATGGLYEASSLGRVRSKDRIIEVASRWGSTRQMPCKGRVLKPWADGNGYLVVYTCFDGQRIAVNVHRLVAAAFHGEGGELHVNHIDGDKQNNRPENLEWCTRVENMAHAAAHGLLTFQRAVIGVPIGGGEPKQFASIREASAALGINHRSISAVALGQRRQTHGFRWEYADAA